MKQIFTNILLVLVIFLSIGLNVSKMHCSDDQCSDDGKFFVGTAVSNCIEKKEKACNMILNDFSCCATKEIETSCCSDEDDDPCSSETTNIQFNFETLISTFEFDFKTISVLFYTSFLYDEVCNLNPHLDYLKEVPLLQLSKPVLTEIQSFLL